VVAGSSRISYQGATKTDSCRSKDRSRERERERERERDNGSEEIHVSQLSKGGITISGFHNSDIFVCYFTIMTSRTS
jgi:hypothetical protein